MTKRSLNGLSCVMFNIKPLIRKMPGRAYSTAAIATDSGEDNYRSRESRFVDPSELRNPSFFWFMSK
jgi:hypothetical protein